MRPILSIFLSFLKCVIGMKKITRFLSLFFLDFKKIQKIQKLQDAMMMTFFVENLVFFMFYFSKNF